MKPCVFVHTNHKQYLGALVSAYSMKRNSRSPDAFDVRLIEHEKYKDFFARYEGREYRRDGSTRRWLNEPPTEKQLRYLPQAMRADFGLTRYQASALLAFQFNKSSIHRLVLAANDEHRRAA
jgi:hypothetical protein